MSLGGLCCGKVWCGKAGKVRFVTVRVGWDRRVKVRQGTETQIKKEDKKWFISGK